MVADRIRETYEDLHVHPELSGQERRTAGIAAQRLREQGFAVQASLGGTGIVGVLSQDGVDGPRVLLRADMDALPVSEQTGLPYASSTDGVMHACGHDMHVACLLGTASELAADRPQWKGTLVVLFQPAEETVSGARAMVDDGLYEKVPRPDVVLGQHVAPDTGRHTRAATGSCVRGLRLGARHVLRPWRPRVPPPDHGRSGRDGGGNGDASTGPVKNQVVGASVAGSGTAAEARSAAAVANRCWAATGRWPTCSRTTATSRAAVPRVRRLTSNSSASVSWLQRPRW